MNQPTRTSDGDRTIQDLHSGLDATQQREAEENLTRYLDLVRRIYERVVADPEAYTQFRTLTDSVYSPTIQAERSNPT